MHTNWFYKCWLEFDRAQWCTWADTQVLPGPGPGLVCPAEVPQGLLGRSQTCWETVVSSGPCQVLIGLNWGEKVMFMFLQSLHLFAALCFQFGHLMAAFKFCDVNCGFVAHMNSFGQHFQDPAEYKYQTRVQSFIVLQIVYFHSRKVIPFRRWSFQRLTAFISPKHFKNMTAIFASSLL